VQTCSNVSEYFEISVGSEFASGRIHWNMLGELSSTTSRSTSMQLPMPHASPVLLEESLLPSTATVVSPPVSVVVSPPSVLPVTSMSPVVVRSMGPVVVLIVGGRGSARHTSMPQCCPASQCSSEVHGRPSVLGT